MSDNAGRKSAPRKDLDGDAELASCIEQLPSDDDLDKARRKRQQLALAHALATGGINARASELLAEIADSLSFWCRVLCEQRGIDYHPRPSGRALGVNHAQWLAAHIDSIAACGDAADITADILGRDRKRRGMIEQIQQVVNRPRRWWQLGDCPTPIRVEGPPRQGTSAAHHPVRRRTAGPEDATRIRCPDCRALHNVHRLLWARKVRGRSRADDAAPAGALQPRPAAGVPGSATHTCALAGHRTTAGVREDNGDPLYRGSTCGCWWCANRRRLRQGGGT